MKELLINIAHAGDNITDTVVVRTTSGAATKAEILINNINQQIFNPIIGFLIALALALFIYGVVEFIAGADNEDKIAAGKKHIMWGVIGLFIMVSVFGIMRVLLNFWSGV